MSRPRLSVIVVSSGRPKALHRCLLALSQQFEAGIELIVVADEAGQRAITPLPFINHVKQDLQTKPNISRARNQGLALAAGELVAFIDDDAAAEPTWAGSLVDAFEQDKALAAATGPVLGRNGISLQWGPRAKNARCEEIPVQPNGQIPKGFVRKLQGTNMAFRRAIFERIGGFDEAYHFFLEDTDVAFRIARNGLKSAWVPNALVHHAYEESARRTASRVPRSLFDIGASTALFCQKHLESKEALPEVLSDLTAAQRERLSKLEADRKVTPERTNELLQSLEMGWEEGSQRASAIAKISAPLTAFEPIGTTGPGRSCVIAGWAWQKRSIYRRARAKLSKSQSVSVFMFEPTPRRHRVRFTDEGWWEQTGGVFGKADRSEKVFAFEWLHTRLRRELSRVRDYRGIPQEEGRQPKNSL